MTKDKKYEVNVTTGEVILRDFTEAELAQAKLDEIASQERMAIEESKAVEKAALLVKLGINENEAKLLFS